MTFPTAALLAAVTWLAAAPLVPGASIGERGRQ